jgi:hypothetical protein
MNQQCQDHSGVMVAIGDIKTSIAEIKGDIKKSSDNINKLAGKIAWFTGGLSAIIMAIQIFVK